MTINDARRKIDEIDQDIISLLGKRRRCVTEIGELKANKVKVRDIGREQLILKNLKQQAIKDGLDPEFIEKVYKEIFAYFIQCQNDMLET
ncbi:chorismate mutase [Dethiobacter alkaliphilus]|uniref:chorismate mutase n=1 Tax=Dethiobacter alkaliphilus TaxID=427926 RepID=UPI00031FEB40|nr:chorismate mutase [Dethiobacter alkaliphilus]